MLKIFAILLQTKRLILNILFLIKNKLICLFDITLQVYTFRASNKNIHNNNNTKPIKNFSNFNGNNQNAKCYEGKVLIKCLKQTKIN